MGFARQFDVLTALLFGLIWLGIVAFLRLKKKKSFVYLIFFTIFYAYLYKVLDYTLFQFQSLLLLRHFVPGLMLKGVEAGKSLNLIPLIRLTRADIKTSLQNILLFVPFGFGLPFITDFRMKKTVLAGALFSIAIELVQLATGLMAKMTFRVADINDVIFNAAGTAVSFFLCIGFLHICRRISRKREWGANPRLRRGFGGRAILRYIADRPQIGT